MSSKQTELWKGEFGSEYHLRNDISDANLNARIMMWTNILNSLHANVSNFPTSYLEVGAGMGINLKALETIYSRANFDRPVLNAVEPNEHAASSLRFHGYETLKGDWLALKMKKRYEVVFTSGVLIHTPEEDLLKFMRKMYETSSRYILCAEYFSAQRREVLYRDNTEALWTDDYGARWLDNFNLRVVSYNFMWNRVTTLDNLTWWLFEKVN